MDSLMSQGGDTLQSVVLAPVDPLVGREVGGYVIEAALGEGGMGLVYQARHPFLGRRFAIKVLRPEFAADTLLSTNFVREAQTLSGLKHPHIIDIVGFGPLDDQRQYMVMEYLDGRTLEAELAEQLVLSVPRVLALADQILDALEAAHSINVIHRDLKPSNVFLARVSGGAELVKLLDFGLAKLQPAALLGGEGAASATLSVISGTPDYIAPEQALGREMSKLSDLYSFGVVLFELLKGRKLFVASPTAVDPILDLLNQHLHVEAPLLGELFPEELERLVAELLEKRPADRPQSAQLVRQRLRRIGRELQREETRQGPNPLLLGPGAETEPILLIPPRKVPRAPFVVAAAVLLLGAVGWWRSQPRFEPVMVQEPVSSGPLPDPLPDPLPRGGEGAVAAVEVFDELAPLPVLSIAKPVKPVAAVKKPVVLSGCEPTERWRAASQAHLQELQQLAASRADAKVWARFEKAEDTLTSAIGAATTGADCSAVERRIQQLAKELSR